MSDLEIKGSGGSANLDTVAGTVTFTFKGLMTSKAKKALSPYAVRLADVHRLEFTLPRATKPGHIRLLLQPDQRVLESSSDPNALGFTDIGKKRQISSWIQEVVDAYLAVRPDGIVAEENSYTLRAGIQQIVAEGRTEIRQTLAEARAEIKSTLKEGKASISETFSDAPQPVASGPTAGVPKAETPADALQHPAGIELIDAPRYSLVEVISLGSTDGIEGIAAQVGDVMTLWTPPASDENPFVPVEVCGVIDAAGELTWLPDDAVVRVVASTRYAGKPETLSEQAKPMAAPAGSRGPMVTAEGFHPLIWANDRLMSVLSNWTDAQISVEELLCALNVAPNDPLLRGQLLAALKAQWSNLKRDPGTYPPAEYPWRHGTALNPDDLDYFRGRS